MSLFRSENNTFCDSVLVSIDAGGESAEIRPSPNFITPVGPCRLSSVCVGFDDKASGKVTVSVNKRGVDVDVAVVDVSAAGSTAVIGIGLWLSGQDYVKVSNATTQAAKAVVDFDF